ncbi:MAG: hypothetical protein ACRD7E_29690 [Bryobacteraceae bacterium]
MARDLKKEIAVSALIKELVFGQASDGQAAEDKMAGAKAQILHPLFALDADQFDASDALELLFGNQQVAVQFFEDLASGLQCRGMVTVCRE